MLHRRALLAAPALLPATASAQAPWPDHPVTMVVPFAPGGAPDIAARIVAPRMTEALGQPVIVENRTGAGSTIGARSVIQAKPDGYTTLMGSISIMMAPLTMDPIPFDAAASLRVASLLGVVPYILVVRADIPAKTIAEFHAYVARNRGKLNFGSAGNGTPLHLGGELYNLLTGADLQHVAYRGTGPAMTDLLAGQVQMVFGDVPGVTPHIRSGAVRPLAALVPQRIAAFPDLPTMAESDPRLAGYEVYTWVMLTVPKATPDAPVTKLHDALVTAARAPEATARLQELGFALVLDTPAAGDAFLAKEQAKWADIIKRAGIKADF